MRRRGGRAGVGFVLAAGWIVLVLAAAVFADVLPIPSPTDMDLLASARRRVRSIGSAPTSSAATSCPA